MKLEGLAKWNKRMPMTYAFGIWSMIASYAYFRYDMTVRKEEEAQEQEDPNIVVHQTAHTKTVIHYKKDFVPHTTKIYNFISTLFSSGPGSGDMGK